VLVIVLIGAVIAPGVAFSYDGRLSGALWPDPAHPGRPLRRRPARGAPRCSGSVRTSGAAALLTLVGAGAALIGTPHPDRLLAMTVGLAVAGASMFLGHARVRRTRRSSA
jgi:hypothetical protein